MLKVNNLSYEINGRSILKEVSFEVNKGEMVAVLGANGAGKSTLMNLISGEKSTSNGIIEFHNQNIKHVNSLLLAKSRALLSQQFSVSLAFTVKELVLMGRYPHFVSNPSPNDLKIVKKVMDICGVNTLADRSITSLSGGEQQRVHLARVLAQIWNNSEALLLLDEPVSALDMRFQQQVLAIAKALSRQGMMVLVILHDVNLASMYADRILMLKQGRKVFDGTPIHVLTQDNISKIFSVSSEVHVDPMGGKPFVRFHEVSFDLIENNLKSSSNDRQK